MSMRAKREVHRLSGYLRGSRVGYPLHIKSLIGLRVFRGGGGLIRI